MKRLLGLVALFTALLSASVHAATTLAWDDVFDPGEAQTSAGPVATAGMVAYVAGAGPFKGSPSSNADIHLRAYYIANGAVLWEDVWDASGIRQDDEVHDLAISGHDIIVAGSAGTNTAGTNAFVVRAYDRTSGTPAWEDRCGQFSSAARVLAATATRVFVAGTCSPATTGVGGLVRAYATANGHQLWETDDLAFPMTIIVSGGTVVVAGAASDGTLSVSAYRSSNGRLLWQITPAGSQGLALRSAHLTASGTAVYLAWSAADAGSQLTNQLAAYDLNTGRSHWRTDTGDAVEALALANNRLFTGEDGTQVLVSAYAASDGRLLWRDQPGTAAAPYVATSVTTGGGQVLVAGHGFDPSVEAAAHFMVRAYDRQGHLLWHDDTATQSLLGAGANDVVWSQGFVIAAGFDSPSAPPFGNTHWLVRAYSTSRHGHGF